jgi:hypothetical protein
MELGAWQGTGTGHSLRQGALDPGFMAFRVARRTRLACGWEADGGEMTGGDPDGGGMTADDPGGGRERAGTS